MKANYPDHALGGQCLLVPPTTQANLNFLKRLMMFVLFCEQTFCASIFLHCRNCTWAVWKYWAWMIGICFFVRLHMLLHGESLQAESCSVLARSMDSGATLAVILALPWNRLIVYHLFNSNWSVLCSTLFVSYYKKSKSRPWPNHFLIYSW
jgi:hypothetical protein